MWRPACSAAVSVFSLAVLVWFAAQEQSSPGASWPGSDTIAGRLLGTSGMHTSPSHRATSARSLLKGPDPGTFCRDLWQKAVDLDIFREKRDKGYNHGCLGLPVQKNKTGIAVLVGKTGTPTTITEMEAAGMNDFAWMHVHPVRPRHFDSYKDFVILARDPVARTASAFAWRPPKDKGGLSKQKDFNQCFPNFDTFALSLTEDTPCGNMARGALRDPLYYFRGHLARGMCWYVGGLLDKLRSKNVHVLRTEHHRDDLNRWLRDAGHKPLPDSFVVHKHDNSKQTGISIALSEQGRRNLEKELDFEYWALKQLLALGGLDGDV